MINKKSSSGINDSYENKNKMSKIKKKKREDPLKERIILLASDMNISISSVTKVCCIC